MIRPIVKFGDTMLQRPADSVRDITPDLRAVVRDMIDTMHSAPGIGLAAPQIGVPLRLFVVDLSVGHDPNGVITLLNPEFVDREGMQLEEEGCLSLPGFNATVARPRRATVRGLDLNGRERVYAARDLLARAFQHEMDHLDGRVFVDRLRAVKRSLIVHRIRRQIRRGRW